MIDFLSSQTDVMDSLSKNLEDSKDLLVGSYDLHNNWTDYDEYLFKDFDTQGLTALEYGCGPGRNIIRFKNRFARIDGVDISAPAISYAKKELRRKRIVSGLKVCDGKSIPLPDDSYDVVFSVICLQHISNYDVRFNIYKEMFRVLKPGGRICLQLSLGDRFSWSTRIVDNYHLSPEKFDLHHDLKFTDEKYLIKDLTDIGFTNYASDIRPTGPGDNGSNWLWAQAEVDKP